MKRIYLTVPAVCVLSTLALSTAAFADEIQYREFHQEQRIDQGIGQNQLNSQEQRNLQQGEARIASQETRDLRQNHGTLTSFEAAQLNHRLNDLSWYIYRDRHY
jgi:hypothetical protein